MTAPAINPLMTAPGLASGGGGTGMAGAPTGALAGFEALLAALFGDTDIAGVPVGGTDGAPAATPVFHSAAPVAAPLRAQIEPGDLPGRETGEVAREDVTSNGSDAHVVDPLLLAFVLPQTAVQTVTPAPSGSGAEAVAADAGVQVAAPPIRPSMAPPMGETGEAPAPAAAEPLSVKPLGAEFIAPPRAPAPAQADAPAAAKPPQMPAPASLDPTEPAQAPSAVQPAANASTVDPAVSPPPLSPLTASTAREEISRAADAPPTPPSRKEKKSAGGVETLGGDEAEAAPAAQTARAPAPAPPTGAAGGKAAASAQAPKVTPVEPEARRMDSPDTLELRSEPAETRAAQGAAPTGAPVGHAVRGAPETVASLAAHILKKLDARSTRFDVELDPAGLGKVDVRVEINAQGRVAAALAFDNPQAAAELKARSGELQRALEQAGFDLSGGLSFDVAGERGQARQDWSESQGHPRGRAFQQALDTASEADLAATSGELRLRRGVIGGVDVRI